MTEPTSAADILTFYKAEAVYWRGEAERLRATLRSIERALRDTQPWLPPEPPEGTRFVVDGELAWTRTSQGWICCRESCANCPTIWHEVHDRIGDSVENITRLLPPLAGIREDAS